MKVPSVLAIPIALLITIIATNVPQSNALSPEETCSITKNNSFIGDPNSCGGWNFCVNGAVAKSGKCGTGLLYSIPRGVCDYASDVDCSPIATTMCSGLTNVFKPDPTNCQNYFWCENGVASSASCPKGMYFEPKTVECVWKDQSSCVQNNQCTLCQNGFVKSDNCTRWHRCFNGMVEGSGNCRDGLLYNVLTASCDYAKNVQCSSSGPTSPTTPTTPVATAATCASAKAGTYVTGVTKSTDSCRGYFLCENTTAASAVYGLCPLNSSFNPTTQECNDPNRVSCPGNRCEGVDREWMAVPNSGCKQYTYCSNGIPGAAMSCNSQYPYYNEVDQVCQKTQANFTICTGQAFAI